ncbi:MAG: hypothetical protein ABSB97_01810 [Thermoplasmata archaeon]|jgi:hypothetical protein
MPFVGATVLLVVLILLTPTLLSISSTGPGVLTQAELIVDRISGNNSSHFYVRGYGSTVRYAGIWIGVATDFAWSGSGSPPWANLTWTTWWNDSDVVTLGFTSLANPVAVNVTAYYTSSGGTAIYVGILAFVVGPGPGGPTLYAASLTSGISVPSSTPVDNNSLPLPVLLAVGSSGSPP